MIFSKKLLKFAAIALFWLVIWILISISVSSELLFPSPYSVISSLGMLIITPEFWYCALLSLLRVFGGIIISLVLGTTLAILTEKYTFLKALLSPILTVIKATPVASFIILSLLWISRGALPLFIISLIVIPIVWSNVSEGIRNVDKSLIQVTKVYGFTAAKKLTKLYIPSVAPFFMAACKSSLGMAWKAGISAEVLATPDRAIGTQLYFSKVYLETPDLFAWTLVIILLSVLIEKFFVYALRKSGEKLRVLRKGGQNDKA